MKPTSVSRQSSVQGEQVVWESEGEVTSCVAVQERTALVAAFAVTGGSCSAIGVECVLLPAAEPLHCHMAGGTDSLLSSAPVRSLTVPAGQSRPTHFNV